MWNTWTFYQCIIVHISSTSPCYSGNDTFLKRKGDEERFLWNHPSASAHTPSGPPLVPQTIDTWAQICQMRLESSLKWPRVEYSSDSSRTCSKKVTTKSADNQSVQKVFFTYFAFIVLAKSEFWFPEAVKAPAWFLSLVWAEAVKWQFRDWNDSLTHWPVSRSDRFDPEGSQSNLAESDDAHEK